MSNEQFWIRRIVDAITCARPDISKEQVVLRPLEWERISTCVLDAPLRETSWSPPDAWNYRGREERPFTKEVPVKKDAYKVPWEKDEPDEPPAQAGETVTPAKRSGAQKRARAPSHRTKKPVDG